MRPLVGAVLQGGRSTRMGTDKARVLLDGRPLREHMRALLAPLCDEVVLVGGVDGDVHDDGDGPFGAVCALLASGRGARYLVVPTDMPALPAPLLRALVEGAHGRDVSFADQPLPLLVHHGSAARVRALQAGGERRVRALVEAVVVVPDAFAADAADAFANVNTPEALAALAARGRSA